MTKQSGEWQKPLTPWEIVQRQPFYEGKNLDATSFSEKYTLPLNEVRKVFSGEEETFSPNLCAALSCETGMSEGFFRNLSDQHMRMTAQ